MDSRLLATPAIGIGECKANTIRMAELVKYNLTLSFELFDQYSDKRIKEIEENETKIDRYEDHLGTYLVKLSSKELSDYSSKEVSKILHVIGDFERIGDHCSNIAICIIQVNESSFETHEYLHEVKSATNGDFVKEFEEYKVKYAL